MSTLITASFWVQTAERAVKTVAQTAAALIGAAAFDLLAYDWAPLVSVSLGAGLVSVLTSVASAKALSTDSPSLV